jgi:hypothetical protein
VHLETIWCISFNRNLWTKLNWVKIFQYVKRLFTAHRVPLNSTILPIIVRSNFSVVFRWHVVYNSRWNIYYRLRLPPRKLELWDRIPPGYRVVAFFKKGEIFVLKHFRPKRRFNKSATWYWRSLIFDLYSEISSPPLVLPLLVFCALSYISW